MSERQCGTCGMCCKLPLIVELNKPPGVWCPHAIRGKGCGAYDTRPEVCRVFSCNWLGQPNLDDAWRPDRCGFILHTRTDAMLSVLVEPSKPDAWRRQPYYAQLRAWAQEAMDAGHGGLVVVSIGPRMIVVLPHRDVDLGPLGPGHKISVVGDATGVVRRLYVEVVSPEGKLTRYAG